MRLAILSDIHEDYVSLQKIVGKAESHGYDKLICLGDISGFSLPYYTYEKERDAPACLALLREKCDIIIPGNHDLYAAGKDPALIDELKGQETWQHELDMDPGYGDEEKSYLAALPFYERLDTPAGNILFTHYACPNLSGFVKGFYNTELDFRPHFSYMKKLDCKLGFMGHAHPPGYIKVSPRGFRHYRFRSIRIKSSPTIIGVPPATRQSHRSSFCIFDTISRKLQVLK